jgi:methyl-accepting chemotaxis protein
MTSPQKLRARSIRTRLLIQILPAVALAVVALTAVAVKVASTSQRDAVYGQMSQLIATQAARFDSEARRAQSLAHGLAASVIEHSAERMRGDLRDVAGVAESSSASTEQVSASAQQTSASTQEIASSAQALADQATRLEQLVGRFVLQA